MPSNKIAVLFDSNGVPVDAYSWDDQYSWGGPPADIQEPGDRLEIYVRRKSRSELEAEARAAEDKLVKDRLEAARELLRANGELEPKGE